ncbi:restriction endonuclease subunit S [Cohnella ginsengisoli]|uniref:Restriction endonuclease subunit S n=1 Tax=Cohnella ginsengisoli TaxID=425004 RepID=A0A9X4KHH5_9BACL|nr:restriction endonuclease subunit S [Cohnella ginsengisoli]MDG0792056.1 restriction endonuclease subunit S [Cohnella ginsengisoli]
MKTINELCSKITDGEHLNPVFADSGVKMLMANNIQDELELTNCKYISESDHNKFTMKCNPEFGDILMVSRGATIGRACINNTTEKFSLMGSVILIKPNISFITNRYLLAWLRHDQIRDRIANTSSASAQQAIYMKDLKKKIIMCPPLPPPKPIRRHRRQNRGAKKPSSSRRSTRRSCCSTA